MKALQKATNGKQSTYLPKAVRELLTAVVERIRQGEDVGSIGAALPKDSKRSISLYERRLAVDFLRQEGVTKSEIARLLDTNRQTVLDDTKWLAEMRRKQLSPNMVVDYWLIGVKAMESSIETAQRMKMEMQDPEIMAQWTRIETEAGRHLASEMRQLAVSEAMVKLLKESRVETGGMLPDPGDPVALLDYIYKTKVLGKDGMKKDGPE